MDRNKEIFEESKKYMPGGVNSPVRSFGSVGINPPVRTRMEMNILTLF